VIAIIDYKMGNLRSVEKGFEHAGVADVVVTDDAAVLESAHAIVLPGVGAFRDASTNLRESGMWEIVLRRVGEGTPFLGICLGLQLLATVGLEDGEWEGLGLVPGRCERLPGGVKVPHIGWNTVSFPRESELFATIPGDMAFYFVHSYYLRPDDESAVIATADYGIPFAAAVQFAPRAFAVQFHPEKSSTLGLAVLANFGRIAEEARA
jgi:glutamine amidotransferase